MKKLALLTLAAAAIAVTAPGTATAQAIHSDPGLRLQDSAVVKADYYYRRHHRHWRRHYYSGGPYYGRYYGGPYAYAPGYPTWNGCRRGFTVQDGVCKPYRGF